MPARARPRAARALARAIRRRARAARRPDVPRARRSSSSTARSRRRSTASVSSGIRCPRSRRSSARPPCSWPSCCSRLNWIAGARMAALVCGSLAYDTVMVYPGRFRDHILPDKIHVLNVSFVVPTLRRNFGGCAGNIAYNLRLLDGPGHAMGTVGHDFGPYREWMTTERHVAAPRQGARRRVHGAGLHHDGPRRQPAHGLPSGRDDAFAPPGSARRRQHHASASARPTGATA